MTVSALGTTLCSGDTERSEVDDESIPSTEGRLSQVPEKRHATMRRPAARGPRTRPPRVQLVDGVQITGWSQVR